MCAASRRVTLRVTLHRARVEVRKDSDKKFRERYPSKWSVACADARERERARAERAEARREDISFNSLMYDL